MSLDRSLLVDRRVGVAFLLQVVGYAALLAVFPHSEPSAAVEALDRVPTVLLIPFAVPALPALAIALAVGAGLSLVGLPPSSLPRAPARPRRRGVLRQRTRRGRGECVDPPASVGPDGVTR